MAKQVQLRRGSNTEHATFTGGIGELTYVSDDKTLRIHDGATASGVKVITEGTGTTDISNDLAVNTDKMTVASATGNTVIAGTLDVTGNITGGASSVLYVPGSIVQIQYTQTDTTASYTPSDSGVSTSITALAVTITPKSSSSKIMLDVAFNGEVSLPNNCGMWIDRTGGSSSELRATAAGSRANVISPFQQSYNENYSSTPDISVIKYFDSPGVTSAVTYTVKVFTHNTNNIYLNRTVGDTDTNHFERMVSYISATEIAG